MFLTQINDLKAPNPLCSLVFLMSFACQSYVLLCHSYVIRLYSYVIRMSLVCTRMSSVCHSYVFFFYLGFLSQPFTNHTTAGEEGGHVITPHYHFHPLHRHLNINRVITAERSPLHIGSSWTRTVNHCLPSASR